MIKNNSKTILTVLLLLLGFGNFFFQVWLQRQDIFQKFDSTYWTNRYNASQWVTPASKNPIGDDGLYVYVGYALVHGKDPSLINAELPPFGKYLVGIFEIVTGYVGAFSLTMGFFSLVLFFLFSKELLRSSFLASICTIMLSFESLFMEQIRAPFLDTLYLNLFLLASLFFLRKWYLLSAIAIGLFIGVKSPFLGVCLIGCCLCYLFIKKNITTMRILTFTLVPMLVYILSYSRMFFLGHSVLDFLKLQKYILHFYASGAKGVFGAVIPMLVAGKWYTWFGQTLIVQEWTVLWPISFLLGLFGIILVIKERNKYPEMLFIILWVLGYLGFLFITPIFPRYLLLLVPFLYNLAIWSLLKSIV